MRKLRALLLISWVFAAAFSGLPPAEALTGSAADAPYDWLGVANSLRSHWSVSPQVLVEDPQLSSNEAAHVRYIEQGGPWYHGSAHAEDPASPFYTAAGDSAAGSSVLYALGAPPDPVGGWIATPLHGGQVLNPGLNITGFAGSSAGAGMNTLTHLGDLPRPTSIATWPSGTSPVTPFTGGESPDPLTQCGAAFQSHTGNFGPTLFASFPDGVLNAAGISLASLQDTTTETSIPVCTGLNDLMSDYTGVNAMLPLNQLQAGHHYVGSMSTLHGTANWDFTAEGRIATITAPDLADGVITAEASVLMPTLHADQYSTASYAFRPTPADRSAAGGGWKTVSTTGGATAVYGRVPAGEIQLRVDFTGSTAYSSALEVYTLRSLPPILTFSPSVRRSATAVTYAVTPVLRAASGDDSKVLQSAYHYSLFYRTSTHGWSRWGGCNFRSCYATTKVTNSTLRYQLRSNTAALQSSPVYAGLKATRSVSGWPGGHAYACVGTTCRIGFTVTVSPQGSSVYLQRRYVSGWRNVTHVAEDRYGRSRINFPHVSGDYRIVVPGSGQFATTVSQKVAAYFR